MKLFDKFFEKIHEIVIEDDDYEDEEPLTEEDKKWIMFMENPLGTIARIIGVVSDETEGNYEDQPESFLINEDLELTTQSGAGYVIQNEKTDLEREKCGSSKIIKYDFKNKREL